MEKMKKTSTMAEYILRYGGLSVISSGVPMQCRDRSEPGTLQTGLWACETGRGGADLKRVTRGKSQAAKEVATDLDDDHDSRRPYATDGKEWEWCC